MGLAGQFGNEAYVCKGCGARLTAFAPHCPNCLGKNLAPVAKVSKQHNGPMIQGLADPNEAMSRTNPIASFLVIAALVSFFGYVAYSYFTAPKPEPPPIVQVKPQPVRTVVRRPVVKHVATSTPKPRAVSSTGTAPRKAAPMRLWEASDDE